MPLVVAAMSVNVLAQRIVKVLIFMITGDYAVVQRLDDMESWRRLRRESGAGEQ